MKREPLLRQAARLFQAKVSPEARMQDFTVGDYVLK
jgi:hypothetical protein